MISGLIIGILALSLGLRAFLGSFGKIKSVDEEIHRISKNMKFGDEEQRQAYTIFMYRCVGFVMTIMGILGIILTIVGKGETIIIRV